MNGMEVLEKTEIMTLSRADNWWVGLIIIAIGFICLIGSLIYMSRNVYDALTEAISFVFLVLSCLLIVAGIGLAFREVETPSGKHEYTVRISDDVSFNEIHEKYEIIEEEDGIYTLREKEK